MVALVAACILASALLPVDALLLAPYPRLPSSSAVARMCSKRILLCAEGMDEDVDSRGTEDIDWREMRARLVAQEKSEAGEGPQDEGFVYECPILEQGSVILGGTEQEFGFALRQQYFQKSVMLLLQHDESFTKGIIINRPSAYELDGFRVWFGGDVAEGALCAATRIHPRRGCLLAVAASSPGTC